MNKGMKIATLGIGRQKIMGAVTNLSKLAFELSLALRKKKTNGAAAKATVNN
jgi:hypothetical protein